MHYDEFLRLALSRQSCRSFDGREVDRPTIDKILQLTAIAPSACNSQPWSFIVLSGESAEGIKSFLTPFGGNKFIHNCNTFIAVIEEKANLMERLGERFLGQDFTSNDIGLATAHMVLGAQSLGVSSCILGAFRAEKAAEFLGTTKPVRLVVALGYAAEGYELREKRRKNLADFITYK